MAMKSQDMSSPPACSQGRQKLFDKLGAWNSEHEACIRYFIYNAQYCKSVQALATFVNILLPFQKQSFNHLQNIPFRGLAPMLGCDSYYGSSAARGVHISLVPYIRRLVATGFCSPSTLYTLFGESWYAGVKCIVDSERMNYLFATKSESWLCVKSYYDMGDGQEIPFLAPLQQVTEEELCEAEQNWSQWLAMQDWMIGPRTPGVQPPYRE